MSGWLFSVSISLFLCIRALWYRFESDFETGAILLVASIFLGWLVFYPAAICILISIRFSNK
jgi:hypothetical protein